MKKPEIITFQENSVGRPSKDQYYLGIAKAVSKRSTCLRKKYGAVIVNFDRIISTGYNGSPRGSVNCCDVGTCYRIDHNVPSGQMYEKCKAKHAEGNAILQANPMYLHTSTIYIYGEDAEGNVLTALPCELCTIDIVQTGILRVVCSGSNHQRYIPK
jgi:dCMP deaminase